MFIQAIEEQKIDSEITQHRLAMRELDYQIRSNRPLIYLCTHEETRVLDSLKMICMRDDHNWEMFTWDASDGLKGYTDNITIEDAEKDADQTTILGWFDKQYPSDISNYQILILKDFFKYIGSDGHAGPLEHQIVRQLRNQTQTNIAKRKVIVITGTTLFLPPELEKITTVIDWPLPERYHIEEKIKNIFKWAEQDKRIKDRFKTQYDNNELNDIVSAFQGLTLTEIELLCTYMILTTDRLDCTIIARAKRDIIRKSGLIDWIEVEQGINSVGGLSGLKNWLSKRKNCFSEEAKKYGLPANPRGILLVGMQGAGKSLSAQAIADFWNLPLLRLDMGKVFSGIVGSSEENIRSVIKVAESIAPCVLWADEIDKGLSGVASSNRTDGGTASRVFGTVLTWMQEKKAPVYVVATANDVSQLPPELLRKGRFDEIFFVDIPSEEERKEILKIHIEKRSRDISDFNINKLARISNNFTGAEIEAAIIAAMYEAFDDDKRPICTDDIINAFEDMIPLATTMKEQVEQIRDWAKTRARNASVYRKTNEHEHEDVKYKQKVKDVISEPVTVPEYDDEEEL